MTTVDEAIQLAITHTLPLTEVEKIDLFQAKGRVLAQNIIADIDQPPFNKSAMDGYACKKDDLGAPMKIIESVAAGSNLTPIVETGKCVQIFTGSKIPQGADCVVMQENCTINQQGNLEVTLNTSKSNICYQGEDVKKGDELIATGTLINLPDLAIMASAGITTPTIYKKPIVGIICSGDELVDATLIPTGSKIRNTNIYQLWAQIEANGGTPQFFGNIRDSNDLLKSTIQKALNECDMIITTGGASVGQFDLIPAIFESFGAKIHFNGVSMQPGKPVIFATLKGKPLWGLSGNPVSSYLQFSLLTRFSLQKLGGAKPTSNRLKLRLAENLERHKKGRELYIPVKITHQGEVTPIKFNGSAHIAALSGIYGFACMPSDQTVINKGETVDCTPL